MTERYTIETDYMIAGATWISARWNAGELTREDIHRAIVRYAPEGATDDERRVKLLESEAEYARELFKAAGSTAPSETFVNDYVERGLMGTHNEQTELRRLTEALQELHDNWTDDSDDEDHVDRVFLAHLALDDYCRRLTNGAFWW